MRRSRARSRGEAMNLDPFLDVMTNVVGVLVLIAIIVAVQSRNLDVALGLPILHDPPSGARRHVVHCADNKVSFLDLTGLRSAAWEVLEAESSARGGRPFQSRREVQAIFDQHDVGTVTHRVIYADAATNDCVIRPGMGESSVALHLEDSEFRARLATLDPGSDWLFFLVEESSFGVFRSARQLARERGVEVGWYPHESGSSLSFTPDGEVGAKAQ